MTGATIVPCGLYVHVPFCVSKCGYCDFYSVPVGGQDTEGLVRRLSAELGRRLASVPGPVTTIFVGGGTPTVLPPGALAALLEPLSVLARQPNCREFTVEANPATLTADNAAMLAEAGVTRVSVGAQSFHGAELATLGRIHAPEDIAASLRIVRRAGIRQVNLDLIYGIPGQTLAGWRKSLDRAMDLAPEHLALYALTYEAGTPLTRLRDRGELTACDEQLEADMYLEALERVGRRGYRQYEISNFALPGQRCLHNVACWDHQPYIGVGPSAVGYLDGVRYRNVSDVAGYVEMIDRRGEAVVETERVEGRRLIAEMAMLRLRLVEGIDTAAFHQRTGEDPSRAFADLIHRYQDLDMVRATPSRIALTRRGRLYADGIIADFMGALDQEAAPSDEPSRPPVVERRPGS